jgi:hypothetical protein
MDVCLLCLYVVLSCVGRGPCDGLITCPEESYRVSVCAWSTNPEKRGQRSVLDYKRLWMNEVNLKWSQVSSRFIIYICKQSWMLCIFKEILTYRSRTRSAQLTPLPAIEYDYEPVTSYYPYSLVLQWNKGIHASVLCKLLIISNNTHMSFKHCLGRCK